jgi:hypothetical protein
MLFFFELFLFVLIMFTLAVGEFVSRGLALALWLVMTALALVGYLVARVALRERADGEATLREAPSVEAAPEAAAPDPLDDRWARTLLYNWRRTNTLLVLGALAVAAWYVLGLA